MLAPLATFTFSEGASIVALIGAIVTGIVMVRKLGPERDALFITSAQGAAVIMDGLISTLREEVDRCRRETETVEDENKALIAERKALIAENEALREEVKGLRHLQGRRRGDSVDEA